MYKGVQIAVLVVFVVVFGMFTRSQVPISLTEGEILLAIDYAIAETDAVVGSSVSDAVPSEVDSKISVSTLASSFFSCISTSTAIT